MDNRKAALLRCIRFISKVKNGDIISTGQYMNYENFPNLQFKKILWNLFRRIKIELRDSYGEKVPFNSVGVTRAVLMFRKTSDNHFKNWSCKRWLLIVIYRIFVDMPNKRGRGFGALAQTIGRTAMPFLRRCFVPASKRVGADLIEMAAPEIRNVSTGKRTDLLLLLERKLYVNS